MLQENTPATFPRDDLSGPAGEAARVVGEERSDAYLVEAFVLRGDAEAFGKLVRRHGPMVLGVCRRVLRNSSDAEDAFQATFVVLLRRAGSIRPREMVGGWLNGVAYRTALKARSMRQRVRRKETQLDEERALAEDRRGDALWGQIEPVVDQEMSRLPEKYRLPLVQCDLEGRTSKQAAEILGWPEGTVSGRLWRARSQLRARLARYGLAVSVAALADAMTEQAASAAVPPALMESVTGGAAVAASGSAAAGSGAFPESVAAIAKGVLDNMLAAKIKVAAAAVLVTAAVGAGAVVLVVNGKHGHGPTPEEALAAHQEAERAAMAKRNGATGDAPDAALAAKLEAEAKERAAKGQ